MVSYGRSNSNDVPLLLSRDYKRRFGTDVFSDNTLSITQLDIDLATAINQLEVDA